MSLRTSSDRLTFRSFRRGRRITSGDALKIASLVTAAVVVVAGAAQSISPTAAITRSQRQRAGCHLELVLAHVDDIAEGAAAVDDTRGRKDVNARSNQASVHSRQCTELIVALREVRGMGRRPQARRCAPPRGACGSSGRV